jgi:hypothetical protein
MGLEMDLQELKRYAIEHRVEVRFGELLINSKGLVKIPGENKDFRVEDVLGVAETFEVIGNGTAQHYSRDAMSRIIAEAYSGKGSGAGSHTDEEE